MKRYAFIILLCVAVSFVMASCGDDVQLNSEEMCIFSGGSWGNQNSKCTCDQECGEGIFCIGEKNSLKCANK